MFRDRDALMIARNITSSLEKPMLTHRAAYITTKSTHPNLANGFKISEMGLFYYIKMGSIRNPFAIITHSGTQL